MHAWVRAWCGIEAGWVEFLAVGSTAEKPVVVDGEVVVRQRMRVTMSCDHRVIDGASGARFLQTFISIARGRPNRNAVPQSGYISHNADRIRLSMDGGLNLDGEIIQARGVVSIDTTESLRFLRL